MTAVLAAGAPQTPRQRQVRFALVGIANLVVNFAIFNALLLVFPTKPTMSSVIAGAVALVSSYFMNRHWTWRDRRVVVGAREPVLFFALSGVGIGIQALSVAVSHYGLDQTSKLADNIAAFVGILLAMGWRFWSYNKWVFPGHPAEALESALVEAPLDVTEAEARADLHLPPAHEELR